MIKKPLIYILFTQTFLLANNYSHDKLILQISTSDFLYKEYQNNKTIDKEIGNDLNELAIAYGTPISKLVYYNFTFSYISGTSKYVGATWDNKPISYTTDNSYLLTITNSFKTNIYQNYFYKLNALLGLNYRFWARGYDENNPNDYREYYKWFYTSIGFNNKIQFSDNLSSNIYFAYNKAINPTLKVMLGNNPTLNLGNTEGENFGFNLNFNYPDQTQGFIIGYKYTYWKSDASKKTNLVLNGETIQIYEPKSDSSLRTYYIGYFILY